MSLIVGGVGVAMEVGVKGGSKVSQEKHRELNS